MLSLWTLRPCHSSCLNSRLSERFLRNVIRLCKLGTTLRLPPGPLLEYSSPVTLPPWKIFQSSHCHRYNRNKLVFTAKGKPHWVEELNDDFDDMDEDIESYRCTCN